MNETGLFVLHMLQEGKETESILERFRERFDLDKNSAEMDLGDFFTMLKSYQLTEYEEA